MKKVLQEKLFLVVALLGVAFFIGIAWYFSAKNCKSCVSESCPIPKGVAESVSGMTLALWQDTPDKKHMHAPCPTPQDVEKKLEAAAKNNASSSENEKETLNDIKVFLIELFKTAHEDVGLIMGLSGASENEQLLRHALCKKALLHKQTSNPIFQKMHHACRMDASHKPTNDVTKAFYLPTSDEQNAISKELGIDSNMREKVICTWKKTDE